MEPEMKVKYADARRRTRVQVVHSHRMRHYFCPSRLHVWLSLLRLICRQSIKANYDGQKMNKVGCRSFGAHFHSPKSKDRSYILDQSLDDFYIDEKKKIHKPPLGLIHDYIL